MSALSNERTLQRYRKGIGTQKKHLEFHENRL